MKGPPGDRLSVVHARKMAAISPGIAGNIVHCGLVPDVAAGAWWTLEEAFALPKPVRGRPVMVNAGSSDAGIA